jgi:hypothetical protein
MKFVYLISAAAAAALAQARSIRDPALLAKRDNVEFIVFPSIGM